MEIAMPATNARKGRESLFQEILNILHQWPELERRIFCEAHYRGQSPEQVAQEFHMRTQQVRRILRQCDHRLHAALQNYRAAHRSTAPAVLPKSARPAGLENNRHVALAAGSKERTLRPTARMSA